MKNCSAIKNKVLRIKLEEALREREDYEAIIHTFNIKLEKTKVEVSELLQKNFRQVEVGKTTIKKQEEQETRWA